MTAPVARLRRGSALALLLAGSLVASEVLLQAAALVLPPVERLTGKPVAVEPVVTGPGGVILGNPGYPEHDEWGFRNDGLPERNAVVALGDSHTWGTSVRPEEAWPARLARETAVPVYNMGLPTWGVRHYEDALDRALDLAPSAVVVAVHLGNDLFDDFLYARDRALLRLELGPDAHARLAELESDRSIQEEARRIFRAGDPPPEPPGAGASTAAGRLRDVLSDRSRLYGLARALRRRWDGSPGPTGLMDPDFHRAASAVTVARADYVTVFEGTEWRSLLTPRYRRLLLDTEDPRIAYGLASASAALLRMGRAAEARGAAFLVVLLPTKESVVAPRVPDPARHPALAELWAAERAVRDRLAAVLAAEGVTTVDVLQALRDAPEQPYFENVDGHPNPTGHRIIAREVARALGPFRLPVGG